MLDQAVDKFMALWDRGVDVDTEWSGQAADRYALSLAAQNTALTGVQGTLANLNNAASTSHTIFLPVAVESSDFGAQNWPQAVVGT